MKDCLFKLNIYINQIVLYIVREATEVYKRSDTDRFF